MRTLSLSLSVQELDDAWWAVARRGHPSCLPDDPRKVRRREVPRGAGGEVLEG